MGRSGPNMVKEIGAIFGIFSRLHWLRRLAGLRRPPARATSISLNASVISLEAIGATRQGSAMVKDQNGQTMFGVSVTWSSSNPTVASVMVAGDWPAVGTTVKVVGVLGTDDPSDLPEGTGPRVGVRRKGDVTLPS